MPFIVHRVHRHTLNTSKWKSVHYTLPGHTILWCIILYLKWARENSLRAFYKLTVITSRGNKYNADKLIESSSFELNRPRCIMQISSLIPFWWMFVIVRLKINLGIEYNADVIQTPAITIWNVLKSIKFKIVFYENGKTFLRWQFIHRKYSAASNRAFWK